KPVVDLKLLRSLKELSTQATGESSRQSGISKGVSPSQQKRFLPDTTGLKQSPVGTRHSSTHNTGDLNDPMNISNNRSDDDEEMATGALLQPHFHGLVKEDPDQWYRDLQHWCAYKKLDDSGKIG